MPLNLKIFLSILLFIPAIGLWGQSEVDSLIKIIQDSKDDIEKVDAMNRLAFIVRVLNPDSTILLGRQSEKLAKSIDYTIGIANSQTRRAIAHTAMGDYYRALQLFLNAKTIYSNEKDTAGIASCLNNMARVYNAIDDNRRALKNFKEANALFDQLNDLSRGGRTLNNIGYIYKLEGEYDSALYYLRKAMDRARTLNDTLSITYPIYNIGAVFMLQNKSDSAFTYLNHAKILAKKNRDQYLLSLTLVDIGRMYLKLEQFKEAEKYFLNADEVSSLAGMRAEKRDALKYLSEVYERQGFLEEALTYQKNYKAISDSLFNKDLARRMAFQEAEYEFNQKRIRDEVEQGEYELEQTRQLTNAIWTRNTLIVGILILGLVVFLLYQNFSRSRKAHMSLMELHRQIEAQAEELKHANKEIRLMNNNLEKIVDQRTQELKEKNEKLKSYLSSNSHIVRAPLARILGLVDLYDPKDQENLDFINKSLHQSAVELDDALRNINASLSDEN